MHTHCRPAGVGSADLVGTPVEHPPNFAVEVGLALVERVILELRLINAALIGHAA